MILAGDIGGTNTRLAIFDDKLKLIGKPQKFPTGNGNQLESQIAKVLKTVKGEKISRASIAIAGPVIDGVCRSTNIGRTYVANDIRKEMKFDSLVLLNDLVANASGIELLKKNELVTILKGKNLHGNRAVVSPGTGLGEGTLVWDGAHHRAIPSEGGHSRFAPSTDMEAELLSFLMQKNPTVIVEDVCSGTGIGNIFDFFVDMGADCPAKLLKQISALPPKEKGAAVSVAASKNQSEAAILAMHLFVGILGTECANMAVKVFATGGIYLGGGIPPKILPLIKSSTFKESFLTHRTMGSLLKCIPIRVILNDDTALEGAAVYGLRYA